MTVSLLDVNVLLALAWPTHAFHDEAHRWFSGRRQTGWATCLQTQLGFLRLSMQPAVVKTAIGFADAENALVAIASSPHHVFWPLEFSFAEIRGEIRSRIAGHNQLADALLLELAMRHSARLATFDRKISGLLTPASAVDSAVEFIPV